MDKLPDKVKRLDILRIEHGYKTRCNCDPPQYELDCTNRLVYCKKCKGIVDPFDALRYIARYYERLAEYTQYILDVRKEIDGYKPRRVALKSIEHQMGKGDKEMVPTCPYCKEPFDLSELVNVTWVSKKRYDLYRREENAEGN